MIDVPTVDAAGYQDPDPRAAATASEAVMVWMAPLPVTAALIPGVEFRTGLLQDGFRIVR